MSPRLTRSRRVANLDQSSINAAIELPLPISPVKPRTPLGDISANEEMAVPQNVATAAQFKKGKTAAKAKKGRGGKRGKKQETETVDEEVLQDEPQIPVSNADVNEPSKPADKGSLQYLFSL